MSTVTLTRPLSNLTTQQSWAVDHVLERAVRHEDVLKYSITADGKYKFFHLWVDNLASGVEPGIHWQITDDLGVAWKVQSVELLTRRTRYKCLGQKLNS